MGPLLAWRQDLLLPLLAAGRQGSRLVLPLGDGGLFCFLRGALIVLVGFGPLMDFHLVIRMTPCNVLLPHLSLLYLLT